MKQKCKLITLELSINGVSWDQKMEMVFFCRKVFPDWNTKNHGIGQGCDAAALTHFRPVSHFYTP